MTAPSFHPALSNVCKLDDSALVTPESMTGDEPVRRFPSSTALTQRTQRTRSIVLSFCFVCTLPARNHSWSSHEGQIYIHTAHTI